MFEGLREKLNLELGKFLQECVLIGMRLCVPLCGGRGLVLKLEAGFCRGIVEWVMGSRSPR